MKPLVSVIIPVYNVEAYIEKCLESVKNQSLTGFECLIIDDGTKDNSVEVSKKVIGDDKRFKIFHKENGGLSDARNYGLDKAEGEYVFFLDSDDYVDNDLLKKTYEKAKQDDSDIVCFELQYEYDDGRIEVTGKTTLEKESYKENKQVLFAEHSANSKIYRREFLKDKKFIKGMWYEDLAVVPIWIAKANRVSFIHEPLYHYVQRGSSISHSSSDPRLFDVYKAVKNIKEELNLNSHEVKHFYFNDCFIMTNVKIGYLDSRDERKDYYKKNIDIINNDYKEWFKDIMKENYSLKHKIIFILLKMRLFGIVDWIYSR